MVVIFAALITVCLFMANTNAQSDDCEQKQLVQGLWQCYNFTVNATDTSSASKNKLNTTEDFCKECANLFSQLQQCNVTDYNNSTMLTNVTTVVTKGKLKIVIVIS